MFADIGTSGGTPVPRNRVAMNALARTKSAFVRLYGVLVRWLVRLAFQDRGRAHLSRVGSSYGGWWLCPSLLGQGSYALCCGAGEDISFDAALNSRFGMRVICVDPTPRAVKHVERVLEAARSGGARESGLPESEFLAGFDAERFSFVPHAVWSCERTLRFYEPQNQQHVSHSAVNLQRTDRYIEVPAETPAKIVSRFGTTTVALVKLDVEGSEYEVLRSMLDARLLPEQILLEFDEFHHPLSWSYPVRVIDWIRRLAAQQYRLVHVEGSNFLFLRQAPS